MRGRPPSTTLFPYPTLFRPAGDPPVEQDVRAQVAVARVAEHGDRQADLLADRAHAPHHRHDLAARHDDVLAQLVRPDRKSTRLNSSHANISYAAFCLKNKLA